jgi:hypothetical protein
VVVAVGVAAGLLVAGLLQTGIAREPAPTADVAGAPARTPVLDVLHRWDGARSRAWAAGDARALRRLYVEGSAAGRADARLLERYRGRGFTVRGLTMQILAVRVLDRGPHLLRLRVTDRLARGVAVAGGRRVRLPADAVSTRALVLRRARGGWQMASVS